MECGVSLPVRHIYCDYGKFNVTAGLLWLMVVVHCFRMPLFQATLLGGGRIATHCVHQVNIMIIWRACHMGLARCPRLHLLLQVHQVAVAAIVIVVMRCQVVIAAASKTILSLGVMTVNDIESPRVTFVMVHTQRSVRVKCVVYPMLHHPPPPPKHMYGQRAAPNPVVGHVFGDQISRFFL